MALHNFQVNSIDRARASGSQQLAYLGPLYSATTDHGLLDLNSTKYENVFIFCVKNFYLKQLYV